MTFLLGLRPNFGTFISNLMASRSERPSNIPLEQLIKEAAIEEAHQEREDEMDQQDRAYTTIRGPINGKIIVEVDYCDHCKIPYHSTTNCFKLHPELKEGQIHKRRRNGREMQLEEKIFGENYTFNMC